jgi:arginase
VVAAAIGGTADEIDVTLGSPAAEAIATVARAVAAEDRRPLALLGECTLAPAMAGALQRRYDDLALVWLDAHGDLNTPETSPSGFLGGMPFAILLGWCHPELRAGPPLPVERAALVGARDLDPGEIEAIERTGLAWTADVAARSRRCRTTRPLWVHLDGDVLDPGRRAGRRLPRPGGWSAARLVDECAALAGTGRIVARLGLLREPRARPRRDRGAALRRSGARAAGVGLRP